MYDENGNYIGSAGPSAADWKNLSTHQQTIKI